MDLGVPNALLFGRGSTKKILLESTVVFFCSIVNHFIKVLGVWLRSPAPRLVGLYPKLRILTSTRRE